MKLSPNFHKWYSKRTLDKSYRFLFYYAAKISFYIRASFSDFSRALIISEICKTHAYGAQTLQISEKLAQSKSTKASHDIETYALLHFNERYYFNLLSFFYCISIISS